MDNNIKYEMEKYAHFLKESLLPLEKTIEEVIVGRPPIDVNAPPPEVKKEPHKHKITSPYGERIHPITKKRTIHKGIDIGAKKGSPVYSFDKGIVIQTGFSKSSGRFILVRHEQGMLSSYSHLSKILVKRGQTVNQGDKIGLIGSSGQSTGPHLHFRLKYKGRDVDPALFIKNRRIVG